MADDAMEELRQVYSALDTRDLLDELRNRGLRADGAVEKGDLVEQLVRHDQGLPPLPSTTSSAAPAPASSSSATVAAPPSASADQVAEFCSLTGSDPETAAHMLEAMGGNLEQAVTFFFEHGAGMARSSSTGSGAGAQRPADGMGEGEDGEVRAPLPTVRDTLMGPSSAAHAAHAHMLAAAAAQAQPQPPRRSGGLGMGLGDALAGLLNPLQALGRGGGGGGGQPGMPMPMHGVPQQHAAALNGMHGSTGDDTSVDWMFRAPDGLSCPLPFQETRQLCKQSQKWMLVNLQDHENFASHRLNRDVWVDETINNLVASGFVFWQRNKTAQEGQQFIQRYHIDVAALPIIAIVDPRTAGKVREYQVATMNKQDLAVLLTDFLDMNQLDSIQAVRPQRSSSIGSAGRMGPMGSVGSSSSSSSSPARPSTLGKGAADEEDELARALALSMQEQQQQAVAQGGGEEEEEAEAAPMEEEEGEGAKAAAEPERVVVEVPPEPPEGTPPSEVARIQFRLPDGNKRRSFLKTERVAGLYAYVESLTPAAKRKVGPPSAPTDDGAMQREYELLMTFPAKNLDSMMDMTLAEAGLDGVTLMMRVLEG